MSSAMHSVFILAACVWGGAFAANYRINHAGRILGAPVAVTTPTMFNTATADSVMSSLQIMPTTSSWHEDVSGYGLASNSDAIVAQTTSDLSASHRYLDP